jgi:hypothetical protein
MKMSALLIRFCKAESRAMVTPKERDLLNFHTEEIARVRAHYDQYAAGKAKRTLDEAREAYTTDPSEANRERLDLIQTTWLQTAEDDRGHRVIISQALQRVCTDACVDLIPPLLTRAGNYIAWLRLVAIQEEKDRFATYDLPWEESAIVTSLANLARQCHHVASQYAGQRLESTLAPTQMGVCQWMNDAELIAIEGDPWDLQTLDPAARSDKDQQRDFGQHRDPFFVRTAKPVNVLPDAKPVMLTDEERKARIKSPAPRPPLRKEYVQAR